MKTINGRIVIAVALFLIVVMSAWLRIYLPSEDVFAKDRIRFTEVDSYYHMRLADYSYGHFSRMMPADPLLNYTGGYTSKVVTVLDESSEYKPLLGWFVASVSLLTGIDRNILAVYFPAVMGLLLIIPLFFIGLLLVNKWTGLLMSGFVSIMPGELLARTSLGYFDNHASEILLSMLVIMFFIMSFKKNGLWCIGAGISLGLYNLNWSGSPMFTMLIVLWIAVQSIINHVKDSPSVEKEKITAIGVFTLALALIIYLAVYNYQKTYLVIYCGATLLPLIMLIMSNILSKVNRWYYIGMVFGMGFIVLGAVYIIKPMLISTILENLGVISNGNGNTTVSGMRALDFTTSWIYYGMILWAGLAGLGFMIYNKDRFNPEVTLIIVWAIAMIGLSFIWLRFNYYLAVSMALLSAYLCVELARRGFLNGMRGFAIGLSLFLFLVLPNTLSAVKVAQYHPFMPSWGWIETLDWLKQQEKGDYSVLSWWDYGYWIVRESDKAVVCSPNGASTQRTVAQIFTSDGNVSKDLNKYKVKYVVVSWEMVGDKYNAMTVLGNKTKLEDSYVYGLWDKGIPVFVSNQKRNKQPEVKVFEVR